MKKLAVMVVLGLVAILGQSVYAQSAKVKICHANGNGTFNPIVVNENGTGGHFENNGTPKAGHEDDLLIGENDLCPGEVAPGDDDDDDTPPPSISGGLILEKTVVNAFGPASSTADFTYYIDGNAVSLNVGVVLLAGLHTVTESQSDGYVATFGGSCNAQGQVTVAIDATTTCTILNTAIAPVTPGDDDDDPPPTGDDDDDTPPPSGDDDDDTPNEEETPSDDDDDNGGGGSSRRRSVGDDDDEPEVLGAQVSVIPVSAPLTGGGWMGTTLY